MRILLKCSLVESKSPKPDALRLSLAIAFSVFSLPMLIYGAYLQICWFRIHLFGVYYVDYSYETTSLIWIGVGVLSLLWTLYTAHPGGPPSALLVIPVILALLALEYIPNHLPMVEERLLSDGNYLSHVSSSLGVWYETHQKFPANESEFNKALEEDAAAFSSPVPESHYKQRGTLLPYEVIAAFDATGPRTDHVSERPGVIYYSVSSDLQEFWVTMTVLRSDVARAATIRLVTDNPKMGYEIVHAEGDDYPERAGGWCPL